jgi:hypothetical protein
MSKVIKIAIAVLACYAAVSFATADSASVAKEKMLDRNAQIEKILHAAK